MKDKQPLTISKRAVALIGLAATETKPIAGCPSDDELTNYIEGRLKAKAGKVILSHINQCPICREHWLEVRTYLNEIDQESLANSSATRPRLISWQSIRLLFPSWGVPAIPMTAAIAVILLVVGFWPAVYDFEGQIDAGYKGLVATYSTALPDVVAGLSLSSEDALLAFSTAQTTPASRAFTAGLWAGKQRLQGEPTLPLPEQLVPVPPNDTWVDSPWKDYFAFGRWMVLVWIQLKVGQYDQPMAQQHKGILKALLANFNELTGSEEAAAMPAIQTGTRIESLLTRVEQGKPSDQTRDQLLRRLEISMQQLAR